MAAARQRGRDAFRGACSHLRCWRMERAVAGARGSTSCGGSQELHAADLYESEAKSPQTLTYDQAWAPMKRLASVMETAPEDASMPEDAA